MGILVYSTKKATINEMKVAIEWECKYQMTCLKINILSLDSLLNFENEINIGNYSLWIYIFWGQPIFIY